MRNMASSTTSRGIAAIVGVGPNLGRSIARKFAHEGYIVAILARDLGRLSRFADEIAREEKGQVFAIRIDCSETRSVREAFEGVLSLGFVEVLVYNAYQPLSWQYQSKFTDIRHESFQKSLAISSSGAFLCAQQVLPGMVERGKGTILFTGCSASLNGTAGYSELCCGKFALRGLSQCLAREFQPQGVHIAHVVIDASLAHPGGKRRLVLSRDHWLGNNNNRNRREKRGTWTPMRWLKPIGSCTFKTEQLGPKRLTSALPTLDTFELFSRW